MCLGMAQGGYVEMNDADKIEYSDKVFDELYKNASKSVDELKNAIMQKGKIK